MIITRESKKRHLVEHLFFVRIPILANCDVLLDCFFGIKWERRAQNTIDQLGHNGFGVHRFGQPEAASKSAAPVAAGAGRSPEITS